MKYTFTFLLFCFCASLVAQKKQTKASTYSLIRDNTDNKFILGNLELINLTVSGSRMSMAGGPGIKFLMKGLYATADYEYHYLDGMADALVANSQTGYSIYKNQNSRNGEATIGYFFKKRLEKKVRMGLYTQGNTHYYTNVDAHVNKIYGLHVGYKTGFVNLSLPSTYNMATNMQYGWFTFGPSIGNIEDVIAEFTEYGTKKSQYFSRFYFNLIYVANSKVEDVYTVVEPTSSAGPSVNLLYETNLSGSVKMTKFGYNIGYETYRFSKFGFNTKIELGLAPGVIDPTIRNISNLYFAFKVSMGLGKTL
jgi:hypothetical protein